MIRTYSRQLTLLFICVLFAGFTQAQLSTNSSGGDVIGNGGSMAFSLGQVVFTSNNGTTGSIAQGVQNACEIFSYEIIETAVTISLLTFPNPSKDILTLQIKNFDEARLSYYLYNMQGVLVTKAEISAPETEINIVALPSATYLMHIRNTKNQNVQSFKIIRN